MHIPENEIETSKTVGHTKEGKPVVFVVTSGGLNAFFTKNDSDEIVTLGAAPHVAIARYLCEKREPGIVWNEEFLGKSEGIFTNEETAFIRMRELMWSPSSLTKTEKYNGVYLVYNIHTSTFQVLDKSEVIENIKNKVLRGEEVIRELNMSKPAAVLFMTSEFKGYLK